MRETNVWRLAMHFFRRFFENDLVPGGEDVLTTVIRALAIVTAPGLMFAFWLQNQYPQRTIWGRLEDEYFFVMFSFVTMAGVAVFEWEMLFPDRLDFLVLTPSRCEDGRCRPRRPLRSRCFSGSSWLRQTYSEYSCCPVLLGSTFGGKSVRKRLQLWLRARSGRC